jgi:hypothetical protein
MNEKKAAKTVLSFLAIIFFSLWLSLPSLARQDQESLAKTPVIDAKMRAEVVKGVGELLQKLYIFPDKAKEMESLLAKKLHEGAYDKIVDVLAFARALTEVGAERPEGQIGAGRGRRSGLEKICGTLYQRRNHAGERTDLCPGTGDENQDGSVQPDLFRAPGR